MVKQRSVVAIILLLLSLHSMLLAQKTVSDEEEKPVSEAKVAIVFLGPKPDRKFRDSDSGPVMLPPQEGETPPVNLVYRAYDSETKQRQWQKLSIPFNATPKPVTILASTPMKLYRNKPISTEGAEGAEEEDTIEPYITLPAIKENTYHFHAFFPSIEGASRWGDSPEIVSLNLSEKKYKDTKCLVLNYSSKTIKTLFHKEVTELKPLESNNYKEVKAGKYVRIAAKYKNRDKWIYNTAVKNAETHLNLIILYDANPDTNNGRDVAVLHTAILQN